MSKFEVALQSLLDGKIDYPLPTVAKEQGRVPPAYYGGLLCGSFVLILSGHMIWVLLCSFVAWGLYQFETQIPDLSGDTPLSNLLDQRTASQASPKDTQEPAFELAEDGARPTSPTQTGEDSSRDGVIYFLAMELLDGVRWKRIYFEKCANMPFQRKKCWMPATKYWLKEKSCLSARNSIWRLVPVKSYVAMSDFHFKPSMIYLPGQESRWLCQ